MSSKNTESITAEAIDNNGELQQPKKIFDKYSHLRITDTTDTPSPTPVLKIKGEIVSCKGETTTFSGPPKGGKTAFTGVVTSSAIAPDTCDGFPDMEVAPAQGQAVIHFDSEQSRHKTQANLKTILKRAKLESCPDNLLWYNIREENIEDYRQITKEIINAAHQQFGGVHMVIIDGGADYIHDVNDPYNSNALVKFFDDLAAKYHTSVIIIIHLNPNSDKERGHFGSQLQRKSASVLTIKKQDDISFIEPKFLRHAAKEDIPMIQFSFNKEKGYHVYHGVQETSENTDSKNIKRIEELKKITNEVFVPPSSLSYNEAIEKIMRITGRQERIAKDKFKEMKAHGWITQGADKNWRLNLDVK